MSKRRYEVWFHSEPFYMAACSEKSLKALIQRNPSDIKRYKRIEKSSSEPVAE